MDDKYSLMKLPTAYIFSIRFDYRSSRYILLCRKIPVVLVNWPGATRNRIQLFERERSSSCPLRGIRSSPKVRTTTIPNPTWHILPLVNTRKSKISFIRPVFVGVGNLAVPKSLTLPKSGIFPPWPNPPTRPPMTPTVDMLRTAKRTE